jgi:hypothetical protein
VSDISRENTRGSQDQQPRPPWAVILSENREQEAFVVRTVQADTAMTAVPPRDADLQFCSRLAWSNDQARPDGLHSTMSARPLYCASIHHHEGRSIRAFPNGVVSEKNATPIEQWRLARHNDQSITLLTRPGRCFCGGLCTVQCGHTVVHCV